MTSHIDETHAPERISWLREANGHADFPIQNLPLGVARFNGGGGRIVTAIGNQMLDLTAAAAEGILPDPVSDALDYPTLNRLFSLAPEDRRALRRRVSELLCNADNRKLVEPLLCLAKDAEMLLPFAIGDYTDFYVGIHHATNIGRQFRPDNPLLPNYKHVPIGYHGRASSVRLSGVPVTRPNGQTRVGDAIDPSFGPTRRLDYELELAVWIAGGNALGEPIAIGDAPRHIGGFGLLNDWSARDIQAWEYQPLGPFLAKNFMSSVSPWVVTSEALAPFRIAQPARAQDDPRPLPYLWDDGDQAHGGLGLELTVTIQTQAMRAAKMAPQRLSRGRASAMYWTVAQIVTHHASNGCNLSPGDLLGTGTISTADPGGRGSLMEISSGGREPLMLVSGEKRSFLEDGDEIVMTAHAKAKAQVTIGFGECRARVLPARALD